MISRNSVIAACTPWTVVFKSLVMSLIITFMFEPAKLQMNCASASGARNLRRSATEPADAESAIRAPLLRERFCLEALELRLVDGSALEQLLGALDLAGRATVCGDRADVLIEVRLRHLNVADAALGHALAVRDQVDERAEERQHEHEQAPGGFGPAGDVAPEDVAEDRDQH